MDKVQKHNSFNTNTPSSESYKNGNFWIHPLTVYTTVSQSPRTQWNSGTPHGV